MAETILTSIHGRKLGLNSEGQLVSQHSKEDATLFPVSSVNKNQTGVATGSTAANSGQQILTASSATAQSVEITAPAIGVRVDLFVQSSASEMTLGGVSTDIVFKPAAAGVGSSMFLSAVNLSGTVISLQGVTTTQYAVVGATTAMTIG